MIACLLICDNHGIHKLLFVLLQKFMQNKKHDLVKHY